MRPQEKIIRPTPWGLNPSDLYIWKTVGGMESIKKRREKKEMEDLKYTKEPTNNARQLESEIQRNIQKAKTIFKNESNITSRKLFKM